MTLKISLERTRSQDVDLAVLLDGVHSSAVALPAFQRDFVWGVEDVKALLGTVLSAWPMGSLLLTDGKSPIFGIRPFDSTPAEERKEELETANYVVLDGQQRLTALYHAFYGRGSVRYALRFATLEQSSVESLDEAIVSYSQDHWRRDYPTARDAAMAGLIPTTALRSAADFFEWRDTAARNPGGETDRDLEDRLSAVYRNHLGGLHRYDVPAVIVDSNIDPAAIARIFERVNRTGLTLSTFDLVVARSFTRTFNLRELWEAACNNDPAMAEFLDGDGLPVLAVIALSELHDVRQSAILSLTGHTVRQQWNAAVASIAEVSRNLRSNFGVQDVSALPNQNMLTVLGALSIDKGRSAWASSVETWFWYTGFAGAYDVASNTRAVSDYRRLRSGRWQAPKRMVLVRDELLETSRKQSASFFRSFVCLLGARRPRSLVDGVPLESDPKVVSLFDKSEPHNVNETPFHLRTLGVVLRAPGERLAAVRDGLRTQTPEVLASQLVPNDGQFMDPTELLAARLDQTRRELGARTQLDVRLLSSSESDRMTSGLERFNLLIDLLEAQGREDVAEGLEYFDWNSDRSELVVLARDRDVAGRLIGAGGQNVGRLISSLPLRGIHVEVDEEGAS